MWIELRWIYNALLLKGTGVLCECVPAHDYVYKFICIYVYIYIYNVNDAQWVLIQTCAPSVGDSNVSNPNRVVQLHLPPGVVIIVTSGCGRRIIYAVTVNSFAGNHVSIRAALIGRAK